MSDDKSHYVRCPDCDHSQTFDSRDDAAAKQRRSACPNCDRGLALGELPVPA